MYMFYVLILLNLLHKNLELRSEGESLYIVARTFAKRNMVKLEHAFLSTQYTALIPRLYALGI